MKISQENTKCWQAVFVEKVGTETGTETETETENVNLHRNCEEVGVCINTEDKGTVYYVNQRVLQYFDSM